MSSETDFIYMFSVLFFYRQIGIYHTCQLYNSRVGCRLLSIWVHRYECVTENTIEIGNFPLQREHVRWTFAWPAIKIGCGPSNEIFIFKFHDIVLFDIGHWAHVSPFKDRNPFDAKGRILFRQKKKKKTVFKSDNNNVKLGEKERKGRKRKHSASIHRPHNTINRLIWVLWSFDWLHVFSTH